MDERSVDRWGLGHALERRARPPNHVYPLPRRHVVSIHITRTWLRGAHKNHIMGAFARERAKVSLSRAKCRPRARAVAHARAVAAPARQDDARHRERAIDAIDADDGARDVRAFGRARKGRERTRTRQKEGRQKKKRRTRSIEQ